MKDVQVLDPCEIPPIRTEFIEALGQGAFGKVHKAKLKDGLEYFKVEHVWVNTTTEKQKIVAVKELYGEFKLLKPRAYKQTRTLTLVQGGRWTHPRHAPWVFVMSQHFETISP